MCFIMNTNAIEPIQSYNYLLHRLARFSLHNSGIPIFISSHFRSVLLFPGPVDQHIRRPMNNKQEKIINLSNPCVFLNEE